MRLLLDNNLSARLVPILARVDWDVVHVSSLGLRATPDETVLRAARGDDRTLVSADTDFGALLAASHHTGPSVVLVRRVAGRSVDALAALLVANLPSVVDDLRVGSVVVLGDESLRCAGYPSDDSHPDELGSSGRREPNPHSELGSACSPEARPPRPEHRRDST